VCLKAAGLGHIVHGAGRWQGTTGENPITDLNASVFVAGPFPTAAAARAGASADERDEIAFPGGRYLVTANSASYLAQEVSFAAACLASSTGRGGYTF
jgi:hypothetical protein